MKINKNVLAILSVVFLLGLLTIGYVYIQQQQATNSEAQVAINPNPLLPDSNIINPGDGNSILPTTGDNQVKVSPDIGIPSPTPNKVFTPVPPTIAQQVTQIPPTTAQQATPIPPTIAQQVTQIPTVTTPPGNPIITTTPRSCKDVVITIKKLGMTCPECLTP